MLTGEDAFPSRCSQIFHICHTEWFPIYTDLIPTGFITDMYFESKPHNGADLPVYLRQFSGMNTLIKHGVWVECKIYEVSAPLFEDIKIGLKRRQDSKYKQHFSETVAHNVRGRDWCIVCTVHSY